LFTTTLGELAVGGVLFVTTVLLTVLVSLKADFVIKEIIIKTNKVIKILFRIIF
jgi:hypothetical protein